MSSRSREIIKGNEKGPLRRSERLSQKALSLQSASEDTRSVNSTSNSSCVAATVAAATAAAASSSSAASRKREKDTSLSAENDSVGSARKKSKRSVGNQQTSPEHRTTGDDRSTIAGSSRKGKRPLGRAAAAATATVLVGGKLKLKSIEEEDSVSESPRKLRSKLGAKGSKGKGEGSGSQREGDMGCTCSHEGDEEVGSGTPSIGGSNQQSGFDLPSAENESVRVSGGGGTGSEGHHQVQQRSGESSGKAASSGRGGSAASAAAARNDDDDDLGRLHALLEARGIRSELLDALGARGIHLLSRSASHTAGGKISQLISGIEASHDEGLQLQSVVELCQLLVMGNEDTLAGFPVKQAVPALVHLLQMEHNLDMMHHACRALTYMMEALPQSSGVVVEAIPVFLTKLQVIQCMDVAEQALTALEMLSRRHGKAIMQAGGINSCLLYLDFFSLNAQRAALATAANCCQFVLKDDFHMVAESIPILSNRLCHNDKKSVESVCLSFSRLIENVYADKKLLEDLAACDLLKNVQQLVVTSPAIITSSTFTIVVHMLTVLCGHCSALAVQLLKQNMADTLRYLLIGTPTESVTDSLELVSRSPGELFELVSLISVMLPKLPSDGLFSVNALFGLKDLSSDHDLVVWQWQDDGGLWHNYSPSDCRTIQNAYLVGEEEVEMMITGRTYVIEFQLMQQFSENTGTARPVQKRPRPEPSQPESTPTEDLVDDRKTVFTTEPDTVAAFTNTLFPALYVVYNSSPGPGIRYKCLNSILGMFYYTGSDELHSVLKDYPISSHVASMLASSDQKIVVRAVQMANILIGKLPETFQVYFRREGVMHQMDRLGNSPKHSEETSGAQSSSGKQAFDYTPPLTRRRLSDILRKRSGKEAAKLDLSSPLLPASSAGSSPAKRRFSKGFKAGKKSKEGKAKSEEKSHMAEVKEKVTGWITVEAKTFYGKYFGSSSGSDRPELDVYARLQKAVSSLKPAGTLKSNKKALKNILEVIVDPQLSASSFEILHSDLIPQMLSFLASAVPRERNGCCARSKMFLSVFAGLPEPGSPLPSDPNHEKSALLCLVQKLQGCVNQLEQFQVRVHEASGSATIAKRSQTMQFFSTHQIQCFLRRDPSAISLKEWKGGPVRIDPLASIQAIERYLYVRGFAKAKQGDENQSEVDESDDEIDDSMAFGAHGTISPNSHKLEFTLNGHLLPYSMTVFQAVKQFGKRCDEESEESGDEHNPLGRASIWVEAHVIQYQPTAILEKEFQEIGLAVKADSNAPGGSTASASATSADSPSIGSSSRQHSGKKKFHVARLRSGKGWRKTAKTNVPREVVASSSSSSDLVKGGNPPVPKAKTCASLMEQLLLEAGKGISDKDESASALCLLRVLYLLNSKWCLLYNSMNARRGILPLPEFVNSKLTAKATRQLQDSFVIMTGNFPSWLVNLTKSFQFLFPFECRQQLFYSSAFDRDRAMARLQEKQPELTNRDQSSRFVPRLDKRKRTVSRADILSQAETIMNEVSSSRAMLEVSFKGEVGTGLGPTLEFYTLVSRELQRADLKMWRGEEYQSPDGEMASEGRSQTYVKSLHGLFPVCMTEDSHKAVFAHVIQKFRFLGKFLAKAMLDSRMADIPLSTPFYKWMLGLESTLSPLDLWHIDPVLAESYNQLYKVMLAKREIEQNDSLSVDEKLAAVNDLLISGSTIESLDLDFTLPGNRDIELKPGGRDIVLTVHNIEEYLELVWRWTLVDGVASQFKAFREGFVSVFSLSSLGIFYPHELELLLCGSKGENWDIRVLVDNCRPDHGYTHDSRAVQMLFEILSAYKVEQQRRFIQFVTGCPRLPVGGFRSLNPPLTIVRKTIEQPLTPDDFLPSVMTCVSYLKLPDYSTKEVMVAKLEQAASEGQHSFHLS